MKTNNQLIHQYYDECDRLGIPRETVRLYLLELCNEKDYNLYLNIDEEADAEILDKFEKGMKRIMAYEPMNYVLGYTWFYGYKIMVNDDVLIPRYETEELVSNILINIDNMFADYETIDAVDVATGSGAIALTVAKEEKRIRMSASDISEEAVDVARKNAELNGAQVEFFVGNMLDPLIEKEKKVDLLICNPPYIPSAEELETSVVDYEPHLALFGGDDGLKFYREIFENADKVLNKKALMAFEMGWDQREKLTALAKEHFPEAEVEVLKDINAKDRMLIVRIK